jgi:3-methyladenine DNA glycosylase/8-oxoguanine DNA glycosylase
MSLRVVATAAFLPRGPRYEPRRLLRRRVRALRGGPDGIAAAFSVRGPELKVDLVAAGEVTSDDLAWAMETARGIAGVDDDPTEFLAMVRGHPVLEDLARAADPRLYRAPTVFEVYAMAVIEQLVTGLESRRSIARLWRIAGEQLPGTKLHAAPTPAAVRRVPMWRMHEIGVGSRRAATLREGAMRGPALERLRGFAPDVAIEKMQSLRGVGPWTANYVARDAFVYADAVPIDDFHAPYLVSGMLTGEEGGNAEMLDALEPFRPHRARAVLLIENSFASGTLRGGPRWCPPKVDAHRRMPWKY